MTGARGGQYPRVLHWPRTARAAWHGPAVERGASPAADDPLETPRRTGAGRDGTR